MTVYFVGAGPGDPELLTVKAKGLIERADVIVYAGSLVNPEIPGMAKEGAKLFDSSKMALEEIIEVLADASEAGELAVRLQSGDPSIYGAIHEQITLLEDRGVECRVVPGVSSFSAAAALLKREYTVPGVVQTLILTRREGRTPVPEKERLRDLARHRASMAIFLSAGMIEEVVEELGPVYGRDTPAAVVYRASWPDEKLVEGTLGDIAGKVRAEGIDRTALILVGDFLRRSAARSRLYDPGFSHGFRGGV
ncbi:MAG: precorrin-4 C(11)-methyltransferase [Methanobacteriota archaeon]|nr:MAG: precorrin-4 C(11)-methyltransferase [Euryarchaeota archaeon]